MPVDAVQLAHQGGAELHRDAHVRVPPLPVLRDRARSRGCGGHEPVLPQLGAEAPETLTRTTWAETHGMAREVPVKVTGLGTAVLNFASWGWDPRPPDRLSTWFSCPEGTLSPAAAM